MVKKIIARLLFQVGSQVGKSILKAYRQVISNAANTAQGTPLGEIAKGLNRMVTIPMTQVEALQILSIEIDEEKKETLQAKEIIHRFEKLFEINNPEKGGSFYLQSKIFFAKEFLMDEFPFENISKYNPDPKKRPTDTEEPEEKKAEEENKSTEEDEQNKTKE